MSEMATIGQTKTHQPVLRLQERGERGKVCR